jgi:SAM-dependent methyltransferase
MAQNVYDRPDFFASYAELARSRLGLAGAPEWPTLRSLLPALEGRRVADLGCGFGWFCRWAREHGAAHVLGLDISENMLARGRTLTDDDAITYAVTDLETLSLPESRFDLVYSSLAFHYVEDAARLYATIHRALAPGGRLVFSTEHPIYMAPSKPGWRLSEDGRKTWPIDGYFREGRRETDWLAPGVVKYHRTIATTLGLLLRADFRIVQVEEFCPAADQIAANAALAEEIERPMFLLISAERESA